jgi:DNA polymerase III subunit epsilon
MTILLTGFDTETTGLEAEKGDKIVEVALLTYDLATQKLVDKYVQRVDPERAISAKAQEIHGIAYSDLVGMPKFRDIAPEVERRFAQSDLVIAHNIAFDLEFLITEFTACGIAIPDVDGWDTMSESRWACPDGKFPRLEELCFALNIPFDANAAHAAEYDVAKMMECFFEAMKRGVWVLPQGFRDRVDAVRVAA